MWIYIRNHVRIIHARTLSYICDVSSISVTAAPGLFWGGAIGQARKIRKKQGELSSPKGAPPLAGGASVYEKVGHPREALRKRVPLVGGAAERDLRPRHDVPLDALRPAGQGGAASVPVPRRSRWRARHGGLLARMFRVSKHNLSRKPYNARWFPFGTPHLIPTDNQ